MNNSNNLQNTPPTNSVTTDGAMPSNVSPSSVPLSNTTPNGESQPSNIKINAKKLTMISLIILVVSIVLIGLAVWGILGSKTLGSKSNTRELDSETQSSAEVSSDSTSSKKSSYSSNTNPLQNESTTFALKVSDKISVSDSIIKIPSFNVKITLSSDNWVFQENQSFNDPKEQSGICQLSNYNIYCNMASIAERSGNSEILPFEVFVLPSKTEFTSRFSQYKNGSKINIAGAIEAYEYGADLVERQGSYSDNWGIIAQITDDFYLFIGLNKEAVLFENEESIAKGMASFITNAFIENKYKVTLETVRALIADLSISKS